MSNENEARQPGVNPSSSTGTSVGKTTKNSIGTRLCLHNMKIEPDNADYSEKVYSNARRKLGRSPNDDTDLVGVNGGTS